MSGRYGGFYMPPPAEYTKVTQIMADTFATRKARLLMLPVLYCTLTVLHLYCFHFYSDICFPPLNSPTGPSLPQPQHSDTNHTPNTYELRATNCTPQHSASRRRFFCRRRLKWPSTTSREICESCSRD